MAGTATQADVGLTLAWPPQADLGGDNGTICRTGPKGMRQMTQYAWLI